MQKELSVRKRNRLQGHNYSLNGTYYLTLCVKGKHNLLGEIVVRAITNRPQIILSDYGKIVDKAINNISQYYPQINVDKYVIMPNHIHMILIVEAITNRPQDMDDASGQLIASGRLIIAPTTVSNVIIVRAVANRPLPHYGGRARRPRRAVSHYSSQPTVIANGAMQSRFVHTCV